MEGERVTRSEVRDSRNEARERGEGETATFVFCSLDETSFVREREGIDSTM